MVKYGRLYTVLETRSVDGEEKLPSEFLIFKAGENPSTKGTAIFDAEAAKGVIDRYSHDGHDLMVDRNHDSIDALTLQARADASDALAWFGLELRGGDLWAINVAWTPEGEDRLRSKKQRYISPAFKDDPDTGRVLYLVNVALCSMPATLDAVPLVAASKTPRTRMFNAGQRARLLVLSEKYGTR